MTDFLRVVVLILPAVFFEIAPGTTSALDSNKPNILIVMVDDMGFSELGRYGGDAETPNLDRLASQGVRFTQFRNAARCCPTRGSLLTGLYPHQAGLGGMEGPRKNHAKFFPYRGSLHENCVTIAEVLKPLGYRTYAVGKWHVGFPENGSSPLQRGFDRWLGVYEGWSDYDKKVVEKKMLVEDDVIVTEIPPGFEEGTRNITGLYTDKAIEYMTGDPSRPFFLYLPHIAPHFNMGPLPENRAKYLDKFPDGWDAMRQRRFARQKALGLFPEDTKMAPLFWRATPFAEAEDRSDTTMATYMACVDEVDQGIGKIVAALKKTGQWENTLFLFLSDNGAPDSQKENTMGWYAASNTPFSYYKQQPFDGGAATPLIAVWPGHFPEGAINTRQPGHVKDIMATCIEAAGATYPSEFKGKPIFPLESQSLLHAMRDPDSYRDPGVVGWEHQGHRAVISGDWKLVALYKDDSREAIAAHPDLKLSDRQGPRTGRWRLFNLRDDRTETNDLADKMPEKVAEMEKKYFEWSARAKILELEELKKLWKIQ